MVPRVPAHSEPHANDALLEPEEMVLPTLERDGSRRWMQPYLAIGRIWQSRRIVAYILMAVFVVIPHLRYAGKPLILISIPERELTILGHTFLPTDTMLLAFLMLSVFLSIVLGTALVGRVWCGWGCPQTVFLEFLFRPIDRFFQGTIGKGGKPKTQLTGVRMVARFLVYLVLSMFLAHTFLAYFVGVDRLAVWVRSTPMQHPTAFIVMGAATGFMLFDFLFFREQLCMIACPYGRFQSVMLDKQSLIVAYDYNRGEPRAKGKRVVDASKPKKGDCVDCNRCVDVCPTGIDIRNGLQLECINCAQCIDACNTVMKKVGAAEGLIRYSSQAALEGKSKVSLWRPRTMIYPVLLGIVLTAFVTLLSTKFGFDAWMIRARTTPYMMLENRVVQNNFSLRLQNRTNDEQTYQLGKVQPETLTVDWANGQPPTLGPGQTLTVPLVVRGPGHLTVGKTSVHGSVDVLDESDHHRSLSFSFVGPQ